MAACGGGGTAVIDSSAGDSRPSDSHASDSITPACDLAKPWGAPARITSIDTTENELTIWLSEDEHDAYVSATHAASGLSYAQIFVTSRSELTDTFAPLVLMTPISSNPGFNEEPAVSDDGLTLLFASDRAMSANTDIYVATRGSTLIGFGTPQVLAGVDTAQAEDSPNLSADGQTLYFNSNRSGNQDLFVATKGATDFTVVTTSSPVAALESLSNDTNPVVTRDGLTIYFSSDRASAANIYVAQRATTSDPFGAPTLVPELAMPTVALLPAWISADGCRLYGGGEIGLGGSNDFDLWVATKP